MFNGLFSRHFYHPHLPPVRIPGCKIPAVALPRTLLHFNTLALLFFDATPLFTQSVASQPAYGLKGAGLKRIPLLLSSHFILRACEETIGKGTVVKFPSVA
jgi:hypothetical protein